MAESVPWNRFLGSLTVQKYRLCSESYTRSLSSQQWTCTDFVKGVLQQMHKCWQLWKVGWTAFICWMLWKVDCSCSHMLTALKGCFDCMLSWAASCEKWNGAVRMWWQLWKVGLIAVICWKRWKWAYWCKQESKAVSTLRQLWRYRLTA